MAASASKTEAPLIEPGQQDDRSRRAVAPARPNLLKPGTVLQNRYHIQDVLGIGGMSTVYRARDLRFAGVDRFCAVKEMFNLGDDARVRQMRLVTFQREAALLATLSNAAIPRIYDYFEYQGSIYLVLEMIIGNDLETLLSQRGSPFPEEELVRWSLELSEVLIYLHQQEPEPIIFRDLKPSNIMIRNNGLLTLVDFGIARSFAPQQKGTMIGTEGYAPPEQYRGIADARGDIYALGATLHHLATGSDPRGETPFTFAQRPPRRLNPSLSPAFEELILRSVAYTPSDRFGSVEELKQALIAIRDGSSRVEAVPAPERTAASGSAMLVRDVAPPIPAAPVVPVTIAATPSPVSAAPEARLSWIATTADEVRGAAALAGGAVYVGSYDGHLYAIDETDGTVRWRFRAQRGIVSRPLASAELVLFGSEDHYVYAVSRQQGRAVWSFRTTMPVRSSAVADDRSCFIGSDDGFMYRLERTKGSVVWRYRTWGPVRSTPLLTEKSVLCGSDDGYVYSVDRESGQLTWRQHVNAPVQSSPILVGTVVVAGAGDGGIRGFDVHTGKVLWTQQTRKAVIASPVASDDTIYIGSADGTMSAITVGGTIAWKVELCRQITATATIDGDRLYVAGTNGTLYCLDRANGTVRWQYAAGGPIVVKPLVTAEHVVFGSMDGKVYALYRDS